MDDDAKRARMEKLHQARRDAARKRAMERTHKTCPDCVREGNSEELPLTEFYIERADGYVDETRLSSYCRRHQMARSSARLRTRLDPTSPDYDPALHERQKAAKRGWAARQRAGLPPAPRPEISLRQAARQLGVTAPTVKAWQNQGLLPTPLTAAAVAALAERRRGE